MKRELKFRGWHTGLNKMFSAEEMGQDQLTIMPDGQGFINVNGHDTRLSQLVPHMIPMQFTGYKDASGIDIYDGDLLSLSDTKYTYEVLWGDGAWVCHHWNSDYGRWGPLSRFYDADFSKYYINIIGNIHENPKQS